MAVPTQYMRSVMKSFAEYVTDNHLLVFANKGIETDTLDLPYKIVQEIFNDKIAKNTTYLSGPSFASEVVDGQPTCVTVASYSKERCLDAQNIFHDPIFRVYSSDDVIGVEVAGALKNVIAIASGIAAGCGYQMNTRAALITRGLGEITRIGVKLGANPLTFMGLSGVGDLLLTCSSEKSRNFTVGYRIGKGEELDYIIQTLGSVAEGVTTTKAAYELSKKIGASTPIIDEIYHVLYEKKNVKLSVDSLLSLETSHELRHIAK